MLLLLLQLQLQLRQQEKIPSSSKWWTRVIARMRAGSLEEKR